MMMNSSIVSNSLDDFFLGDDGNGIADSINSVSASSTVNSENGQEHDDNDDEDNDDGDEEEGVADDNEDDDADIEEEIEEVEMNHQNGDLKKRKMTASTNGTTKRKKKRKSKSAPTYMRRNIRTLLKKDQLQDDTLNALRAEQDRLKRLEETNGTFPQYAPIYSMPGKTFHNHEEDCIVLEEDDDHHHHLSLSKPMSLSGGIQTVTTRQTTNDDHIDSNDSDVQCVDSDTEVVNETVIKKMRRLHVDDRVNVTDENGNIQVNINHPTEDPDLYIPKHLCTVLKPHQIGGIRFMYDNIVECLERFRTTPGLGCILAHSMGCGKTIQVICFIDILLRHTSARSVLVVVPINTIQNWAYEFHRWCPPDDPTIDYKRPFQLYILNETSKKFAQRAKIVQNWSQSGGALIIGYELFRLLVTKKAATGKVNNGIKANPAPSPMPLIVDLEEEEKNFDTMEEIRNALLSPNLVICDEGHRIKNHQAGVAVALKSIRTHRRIVLTGYPLQNNLIEYWCMVDFVRPNYLGSKLEFCNMFERPILNGQCIDSTPEDGKLMRARAHVLHSLLEGFIQRRGHDVLRSDLPPKTEYVILLKLSTIQRQFYMKFLEAVGALSNSSEKTLNPLRAFAICCKIWNHADVLYKFVRDRQDANDLDLDLDFEPTTTRNTMKPKTTASNGPPGAIDKKEFDYDFANAIVNTYTCGQLSNGIKFQVALTIIDLSLQMGDKVLLFSQSLLSLNKFEEFLQQCYIPHTNNRWEKNVHYYRLDGSTSSLEREKLINAFNAPDSAAKLFLLSTRAGCLGINLIAANRVIVMDVSWNPCLDAQAVCRVFRYGQKKHCYIYRLIADFTMEKRIYDRQITKQGMSDRVVDELQPQNQFTRTEVENLLHFAAEEEPAAADLLDQIDNITDDFVLKYTCEHHAQSITKVPFTHESLLSDRKEHQLSSAEKRRAEKQYQDEKRMNAFSYRPRLNTSRSFPRFLPDMERRNFQLAPSSFESHPSFYRSMHPSASATTFPSLIHQQSADARLEQLRQHGIHVQEIILKNPLEVQLSTSQCERIPAGSRLHLIQGSRGSYIRTADGKFFAIRQPTTEAANLSKNFMPLPSPAQMPQAPLLPPNPINHSIFDLSPSIESSTSSLLNDINHLSDEIDLLVDDTSSTPSNSAFDNLSSWHEGYFLQQGLDGNGFPHDTTAPFSASRTTNTNLDSDLMNLISNSAEYP